MTVLDLIGLYSVACVGEMARSTQWYAKLLGREPDDRPMDGLIQWRTPAGGLQVWKDEERAGRSLLTLVVPDLGVARAELARAGLTLGPESRGDYGAVAQIDDPDGNRLTLAEPPETR